MVAGGLCGVARVGDFAAPFSARQMAEPAGDRGRSRSSVDGGLLAGVAQVDANRTGAR